MQRVQMSLVGTLHGAASRRNPFPLPDTSGLSDPKFTSIEIDRLIMHDSHPCGLTIE